MPHYPPDSVAHALLFRMRLFFDLEVCTVYRDLRKAFKETAGKVLEIGCGLQPYRHLLSRQTEYYALDWEGSDVHFAYRTKDVLYYDGSKFPFKDEKFNLVFHTEVLEHIYHLEPFLSECYRVLTKEGQMLFTVPFAARNLETTRRDIHAEAATVSGSPDCRAAFELLEPNPRWEKRMLELRLSCYKKTDSPFVERAAADLEEFTAAEDLGFVAPAAAGP